MFNSRVECYRPSCGCRYGCECWEHFTCGLWIGKETSARIFSDSHASFHRPMNLLQFIELRKFAAPISHPTCLSLKRRHRDVSVRAQKLTIWHVMPLALLPCARNGPHRAVHKQTPLHFQAH